MDERRPEGQREVAVGDGPAERSGGGTVDVDVDPLVVTRGIGEPVHPLLGDLEVLAEAEVGADVGGEVLERPDDDHARGYPVAVPR